MKTTVGCLQPAYIPWIPFFKRFLTCDYFVLLDERVNKFIHNPLVFLRNNHLNYSITWFLLSLSSLTMLLIIRKKNG